MITSILLAMAMVGGTGVIIGILLGIAGEKFEVEVDEKEHEEEADARFDPDIPS